MSTNDGWIAFKDQLPPQNTPYIYCEIGSAMMYFCSGGSRTEGGAFTHWRLADFAPPKREPTQDEADLQAFKDAFGERGGSIEWHANWSGWKRALAQLRALRGEGSAQGQPPQVG